MKKLFYIITLCIVSFVSYFIGANDIYMAKDCHKDGTESIWYPHYYNKSEALKFEREYANALFEGLHRFYSNDDNEIWFTSFMKTKEYAKIDSLNNHDWEDFYHYETPKLEDWMCYYGTEFEPSEEYKDSVEKAIFNYQLKSSIQ